MATMVAYDIGTTHLKWIIVEMARGQVVARGQELVEATSRDPASEQDPARIRSLMQEVLRKARETGPVCSRWGSRRRCTASWPPDDWEARVGAEWERIRLDMGPSVKAPSRGTACYPTKKTATPKTRVAVFPC